MEILRPLIGMDKDEIVAQRRAPRHVSDLDHSRSGLLPVVHAAPSGDARRGRADRGGRACAARSRRWSNGPSAGVRGGFPFPGAKIPDCSGMTPRLTGATRSVAPIGRENGIDDRLSGSRLEEILGADASGLLEHQCKTIPKETLHLPGPDYVDRTLRGRIGRHACCPVCSRSSITGGWAGPGYVSILPVDQGIEHSAGASFAPNPMYFDPENIVKLAIEGGCNGVASTLGVLGAVARKYAHKIPFLLKLNHNEFLSYPNAFDQIRFASVKQAFEMGAMGVGATIYFGSEESKRQIQEVTGDVPAGARAGHVHGPLVLPAERRVQDEGSGLSRRRRSHRSGQPPRRDDRGRHHQAEAAREQRRVHRAQFRQDRQEGLLGPDDEPSDRLDALPGGELLHGPHRA